MPANSSITHRVVKGTGWMLAWRMVSRALGFVSLLVLAQLLAPGDIGIVAIATSVSGSLDALSQLGVREALVRIKEDNRDLYDTAFTVQVARGILTSIIICLVAAYAKPLLGDGRLGPVLIGLAAVALVTGAENIGMVLFSRSLDFRVQFFIQVAPRFLAFFLTTALAFWLRNYWALVWGTIVGRVFGVGLTYIASPHRPKFGFHGWRYLMHFSFWSWVGSIGVVVWSRCDAFVIGSAVGPAMLGIYMIGFEIALLPLSEFLEPASATLFPGFSAAHREGGSPVEMGFSVAGILALGTIPFALGISACSGYLVASLLGAKWNSAQPIIAIVSWLCIFSPFSYVTSSVLSVVGQVRKVALTNAFAALVKIVVLVVASRTRDLSIVAFATVLVVGIESSLFLVQLRMAGSTGGKALLSTMVRALFAALVAAGALYYVPGTWTLVKAPRFEALGEGAIVGLLTFVIFGATVILLWLASGKPAGSERKAVGILLGYLRPYPFFKRLEAVLGE
jgi:lipopolysaccharide exporter